MSIDAFRFLNGLIAQTSRAATQAADSVTNPLTILLCLAAMLALPLTIRIIRQRQLYKGLLTPEPLPPPGKSDVVGLGAALLLGFALSIIVNSAVFQAMGGRPLAADAPAAQRLASQRVAIMAQPASQVATIAGVLGTLMIMLPAGVRAIHLRFDRAAVDLRQGGAAYLLALPWVLLTSIVVVSIVKWLGSTTSIEHEVFTLWRGETPGLTSFKLVMFLGAVILAPIAEEIFFRGLLQTLILRVCRIPVLAIVATSLVFASMHRPWPLQPPIFALSLALGWTYFRSRSLLPAIFMHIGFNAINFIFFLSPG
jgi:uncharacterized protein